MMRQTVDRQLALKRTLEAWGTAVDCFQVIAQHGGFVLEGDGGLALFVRTGPKSYRVTVGFDEDKRGKPALDALNEAYSWVFENTDAETLVGYVRASEKHWMAFSLALAGGKHDRTEGDTAIFSITRERWSKARAK